MRDSETAVKSNDKRSRSRSEVDSNSLEGSTITNGKDEGLKKQNLKPAKMIKSMGATNSRTKESGSKESSPKFKSSGAGMRKGDKKSPELRPRRRASQTYFFKYQLAKNPLKAEEEDLRLALLASLQQCGNASDDNRKSPPTGKKLANSANGSKNSIQSQTSASKRSAIRSLENSSPSHSSTSSFSLLSSTASEITQVTCKESAKKSSKNTQQFRINGSNSSVSGKRRGSIESSSSSIGSSSKDGSKKKLSKDISLLASIQTGAHSKIQNKLALATSCNDFTSVQNRIKKAKKVLQNKKANESKRSTIISKYSALRKFPSNSSPAISNRNTSLLSPTRKPKNGSKVNNFHCNNLSTANFNTTSAPNQCFVPYSPYAAIQKKDPPDEEYLKKYKPETEDFLTFICFRSTVPNYQSRLNETPKIETEDSNSTTIVDCSSPSKTPEKKSPVIGHIHNTNDSQMSKNSTSSQNNKTTNSSNSSPIIHMDNDSPLSQHRRPTRQSPRLASSNRKIFENDNSNHTLSNSYTLQDNSVTYEEDMKRASMALEDMAHEINSSDGIKNEPSSNELEPSKSFLSYKNNKHLVKGLMTREFAGGFADEETIFESISNHKL